MTKILRWIAKRSSVRTQTLLTVFYVVVSVVGFKKFAIISIGFVKEMKEHARYRQLRQGGK
jgi:hypothetical protein